MSEQPTDQPKRKRGFASMDLQRRREIASLGGRAVKPENRAYFKNRELAAKSGAKGGTATPAEKRAYSKDRELAVRSGAKGGSRPKRRKGL